MTAANEQIVAEHHMRVDAVSSKPKKVLIVVANPTTATTVGWPVGFWGAELTHPYYELKRTRRRGNDRQPRRRKGADGCAGRSSSATEG